MKKLIYTKFSNDRNINYKIRTEIYQDEKGKRYVQKCGTTDKSSSHIENMYNTYLGLCKQCEDTIFVPNKSSYGEGVISLEYVAGRTLEEEMDICLGKGDVEGFGLLVKAYGENVRKMACEDFSVLDGYKYVFGPEADEPEDAKCMKYSDIDLIFPNIIIEKDSKNWTILDYEWTFDIKIPVDFILYRAIHYYEANREKQLKNIDMYELLGVDKSKNEIYEEMEKHFQKYVVADNVPIWELFETMGKPLYFPIGLVEYKMLQDNLKYVEVTQFLEDDFRITTNIKNLADDSGRIKFSFDVEPGVKTIFIDPASIRCMVNIIEMQAHGEEDYAIDYGSNGVSTDNRFILFNNDDPKLMIGDIREGVTSISVEYDIDYLNDNIAFAQQEYIKQCENLKADNLRFQCELLEVADKLGAKGQELVSKQQEIDAKQAEINYMTNSLSWKMTKPVRAVRRVVGKKEKSDDN